MGDFDNADAEAAKETDEELKGYLKDVLGIDMEKMKADFPHMADQEIINSLIENVDKATSKAELVEKWRAAGALLTKEGLEAAKTTFKIAKEVFLVLTLGLFMATPASAGILDLDGFFDGVKTASERSRVGIAVNLKGQTKGVGYTPLAWDSKRGYWDIGLGFNAKKFNDGAIGVGLGINLVAMGHDLLKNLWGGRVGILPVPGLWVGPVISAPALNNISARWDHKEKIDFYLTYAFFGIKN